MKCVSRFVPINIPPSICISLNSLHFFLRFLLSDKVIVFSDLCSRPPYVRSSSTFFPLLSLVFRLSFHPCFHSFRVAIPTQTCDVNCQTSLVTTSLCGLPYMECLPRKRKDQCSGLNQEVVLAALKAPFNCCGHPKQVGCPS